MRIIALTALIIVATGTFAMAENHSTLRRGTLQPSADIAIESPQNAESDPVAPVTADLGIFTPELLSFKNFDKTAASSQESFFVTNGTQWDISRIVLRIRYLRADTDELIHERAVTLEVDLPAGATRQVTTKSFDRQRAYYYYASPRQRKAATAFKVAFRVERYDIIAQ